MPTFSSKPRRRAWVRAAPVATFTTGYGDFVLLLFGIVLMVIAFVIDDGTESVLFLLGLVVVALALGGLGYVGTRRAEERALEG